MRTVLSLGITFLIGTLGLIAPLAALGTPQTVTEGVRLALTRVPSLARSAENIEISASGATVTLRGDVNSLDERQKIEAVVRQTNGVYNVDNQITVKGKPVDGGFGR